MITFIEKLFAHSVAAFMNAMNLKFKFFTLVLVIAQITACNPSHPLTRGEKNAEQPTKHPAGATGKSQRSNPADHPLHAHAVGDDTPYFAKGSDVIDASAKRILADVAKIIVKYDVQFQIVGHANNCDDEESNRLLSLRRAENVKRELLDLGVREDLIVSVSGAGSRSPLTNTSPSCGDWFNDRVNLDVVNIGESH